MDTDSNNASGSPRIRVGVLRCHKMADFIANARGQFETIFAAWIETAVTRWNSNLPFEHRISIQVTGYDVIGKAEYPSYGDVDAIIVTGSGASAYDDTPWVHQLSDYLRDVYAHQPSVKIFGGCFGHQIVSQVLLEKSGAFVEKNPKGWEIGVHNVKISSEFAAQMPMVPKDQKMAFRFFHGDHVAIKGKPPPTWINMGSSKLCDIQGWLEPGRILTYQGHPEFDQFINEWIVDSASRSGRVPAEKTNYYQSLVQQDDDRILAGQILIKFLLS